MSDLDDQHRAAHGLREALRGGYTWPGGPSTSAPPQGVCGLLSALREIAHNDSLLLSGCIETARRALERHEQRALEQIR